MLPVRPTVYAPGNIKHILMQCPAGALARSEMYKDLREANTENIGEMLNEFIYLVDAPHTQMLITCLC